MQIYVVASEDLSVSRCSKKDFLLTLSDMCEFGYNIPDSSIPADKLKNDTSTIYDPVAHTFVPSKPDGYSKLSEHSPVFAVDCEMCMTSRERSELTRISIIDESFNVVLDTLVKPRNPIVDYVTKYSGITKMMLKWVIERFFRYNFSFNLRFLNKSMLFELMSKKIFHKLFKNLVLFFKIKYDFYIYRIWLNLEFSNSNSRILYNIQGNWGSFCKKKNNCKNLYLIICALENNFRQFVFFFFSILLICKLQLMISYVYARLICCWF